jgi:hypothetical protein
MAVKLSRSELGRCGVEARSQLDHVENEAMVSLKLRAARSRLPNESMDDAYLKRRRAASATARFSWSATSELDVRNREKLRPEDSTTQPQAVRLSLTPLSRGLLSDAQFFAMGSEIWRSCWRHARSSRSDPALRSGSRSRIVGPSGSAHLYRMGGIRRLEMRGRSEDVTQDGRDSAGFLLHCP